MKVLQRPSVRAGSAAHRHIDVYLHDLAVTVEYNADATVYDLRQLLVSRLGVECGSRFEIVHRVSHSEFSSCRIGVLLSSIPHREM